MCRIFVYQRIKSNFATNKYSRLFFLKVYEAKEKIVCVYYVI